MTRTGLTFVALVAVLGAIAALAPAPWILTDEPVYEATAKQFVVRDCSDLQCFRVLVPWILGRLPGAPAMRWKAYAVVSVAAAAVALGRYCMVIGLTPRAAQLATWLLALGFGPLLTMFNPFTADPVMFLAGPLLATELFKRRNGRAALFASAAVFAKEVAAAPLWIFTAWSVLRRDWGAAARTLAAAVAASLVWVWLQLWLVIGYNYSYGGSKSTDLLHGGDLAVWIGTLGPRGAAVALFTSLGGLLLLIPAGFARADRDVRLLALAGLPAAALLCYVQQPDRALWNFHYLLLPLAAVSLQALPNILCWLFIACYGAANLRVGAQLSFIPEARWALLMSIAIAAGAVVAAWQRPQPPVGGVAVGQG